MYEAFYNLVKDPFRLIPDHRFCFRHRSYVQADAYVQYALSRGEGIVLITGEPGTGKTTLSADLLARLGSENVTAARLVTTQLEANDFLRAVALAFGLDIQSRDKVDVLHTLEAFLGREQEQSHRALLIVDEAHELRDSALTELRLLTNLVHTEGQPLLQVILLGQKDVLETLHAPHMEQLRQRVVAGRHLQPLDPNETQAYIEHRLKQADWTGDPKLNDDLFKIIHQQARGIPRVINLLCSRLLLYGALEERHELTSSDVELVTEGLRREQLLSRSATPTVDRTTTQPVTKAPAEAKTPIRKQRDTVAAPSSAVTNASGKAKEFVFRRTWVPVAGAVTAAFLSLLGLSNSELMLREPGKDETTQVLPAPADERTVAKDDPADDPPSGLRIAQSTKGTTAPPLPDADQVSAGDLALDQPLPPADDEHLTAVNPPGQALSTTPQEWTDTATASAAQNIPTSSELSALEKGLRQPINGERAQPLESHIAPSAAEQESPKMADVITAPSAPANAASDASSPEPGVTPLVSRQFDQGALAAEPGSPEGSGDTGLLSNTNEGESITTQAYQAVNRARERVKPKIPEATQVFPSRVRVTESGDRTWRSLEVPSAAATGSTTPATSAAQVPAPQTTAQSPSASHAVPAVEPTRYWHTFWRPFQSRTSAQGFAGRLAAVTGLQFRVIDQGDATYAVAFAYQKEDERRAHLVHIRTRTGLTVTEE